jgi:hypothetical protein
MKYQIVCATLLAGLLASCSQYQQQGAAVGGLAGGALGAIAGGDSESTIKGAALGAGLGAGIAALQENQRAKASTRDYAPRDYTPPMSTSDYPYAEKTRTPGEVISPYPPYNVMDVRGLRSGSLALDPSSNKKFRVP